MQFFYSAFCGSFFFILIALVALGGWIFAGQALAPINNIMNQVDAILPANMNQRLSLSNQKMNYRDWLIPSIICYQN
ncbi:MAG: hypothetical protein IPM92_16620 [Saprospiraceae bacterium]|nr:hypothetical protein [Saprospiraceae bacterium]